MSYIDQITVGSTTYDIQDSAVPSWARESNAPVQSVNSQTGVITLAAADVGAIAAPSSATTDAVLAYNGTAWVADKRMVILSYGSSTWTDFIDAYNNNAVIYCRASSNNNPASGAQTRMAFMAYVNSATPTSVEFQYYRSVSSHSASQQGDQVFIYKLENTNGGTWSVTTREASSKIDVGTGLSGSYSSGTYTLSIAGGFQIPSGGTTNQVLAKNSDSDRDLKWVDQSGGSFDTDIIADEYDSSSAYSLGDYCVYDDSLYKCNTAIGSGGEAWNSAHWTQTNVVGEITSVLTKLAFTNVVVASSAFVSDVTYNEFPYRASVTLANVTSSMFPEVVFSTADAISGIFSPVVESYNGGVYIYASDIPTGVSITIPLILCTVV